MANMIWLIRWTIVDVSCGFHDILCSIWIWHPWNQFVNVFGIIWTHSAAFTLVYHMVVQEDVFESGVYDLDDTEDHSGCFLWVP
jgi:hypothetical protein